VNDAAWHDRTATGSADQPGIHHTVGREINQPPARRVSVRTVLRYIAGAAAVVALIVAGTASRTAQVAGADDRQPADAIVVLGAAQYDGEPSPVFEARLDHAADLHRLGIAPRVLTLGGGQSTDRTTEGQAGRDYLAAEGIPETALIAVPEGADTLGSLRAAAKTLDAGATVVLVTDPSHAARAQLMATDLGLAVQVSPVQEGPAVRDSIQAPYLLRETLGTFFYRFTGGSSGVGGAVT
jgi:uncharacterized SAM-binding protein YcdF (DUF218 family)